MAANRVDLGAQAGLVPDPGTDERLPAEQRRLHPAGVLAGRRRRRFQQTVQIGERRAQAARLHAGQRLLGRLIRWPERFRQPVQGVAAGPQALLPSVPGDAADRPRVETPARAVGEPAAEHGDQVAQPPPLGGQAQQPP